MILPKGEKRHHPKTSFFSFFGNLPPNNRGELTKKGNLIQNTGGIEYVQESTLPGKLMLAICWLRVLTLVFIQITRT